MLQPLLINQGNANTTPTQGFQEHIIQAISMWIYIQLCDMFQVDRQSFPWGCKDYSPYKKLCIIINHIDNLWIKEKRNNFVLSHFWY